MKKIKVTNRYLNYFITYFAVIPDEVRAVMCNNFDSNNEATVKETISRYGAEGFISCQDTMKSTLKQDLAYYLTISKGQQPSEYEYFTIEFNGSLPPFDITDDPRQFWVWVWEVYYPNEDYHISNLNDYEEDHTPRGEPFEIT